MSTYICFYSKMEHFFYDPECILQYLCWKADVVAYWVKPALGIPDLMQGAWDWVLPPFLIQLPANESLHLCTMHSGRQGWCLTCLDPCHLRQQTKWNSRLLPLAYPYTSRCERLRGGSESMVSLYAPLSHVCECVFQMQSK